MNRNWFQQEELGAGEKRLILSYYVYKLFGEKALRIIAFFVVTSVFMFSKERREISKKFFKKLNKPPLAGSYKRFLNYGNSLVDKFIAFAGDFDTKNIVFKDFGTYENGAFFITTHVGNIEILRAFLNEKTGVRANVFMQSNSCEIFNRFLKKFEHKVNMETFPVEEISPDVSIMISERLKNGEIVFMAGDRVSAQNSSKVYSAKFLDEEIKLPLGVLKFALLMDAPIYFITCIKEGEKYAVNSEKFEPHAGTKSEKLENLKTAYSKFLAENMLKYSLQTYNFYDIFQDN